MYVTQHAQAASALGCVSERQACQVKVRKDDDVTGSPPDCIFQLLRSRDESDVGLEGVHRRLGVDSRDSRDGFDSHRLSG